MKLMICCGGTAHQSPFGDESVTFPGHTTAWLHPEPGPGSGFEIRHQPCAAAGSDGTWHFHAARRAGSRGYAMDARMPLDTGFASGRGGKHMEHLWRFRPQSRGAYLCGCLGHDAAVSASLARLECKSPRANQWRHATFRKTSQTPAGTPFGSGREMEIRGERRLAPPGPRNSGTFGCEG